ncbi:MAG TPA: type IX secretion system membrane protein PorP/SprF [Flavobacteriales bacterium]
MSTLLRIALLGVALPAAMVLRAQHTPLTAQYLFNGLVLNPAYAGSADALTANMDYRHQWVGFEGAPVTQTLSIHTPLKDSPLTVGALLTNDRIGVSNETGLMAAVAYRVPMRKGKLQLGLGGGASLVQARWTELALQDRTDVQFAVDSKGQLRPNFSAGGYYYTKKWFVGLSIPSFLSHQYNVVNERWSVTHSFSQYQPMLTGGMLIKLDRDLKLKPSALIRYNPASSVQADLNVNLIVRNRFWVGASYRTQDALVALLQVLPTNQWRIGYAYELGMSKLSPLHNGTHELMVQYEFGFRVRARDPRFF